MRGCVPLSWRDTDLAATTQVVVNEFFESFQESDLKLFIAGFAHKPTVSGLAASGWIKQKLLKGLILAQNERWRRGLGMQVERIPGGLLSGESGERGSKAWVTYPGDGDSRSNGGVIPGELSGPHGLLR